jgi:uncharacterized protein (TIGR04255 family)
MKNLSDHPSFENPPVVEVVCGVQFQSLDKLLVGHIGRFWDKVREDYPVCHDHPPLAPAIEIFEQPRMTGFEVSNVPPLPRTWFEHKEKTGIIQVQRDRLHHNWRKVGSEHEYPRYDKVIALFQQSLQAFERFLQENEIGEVKPTQYELTYVNHIPSGEAWSSLSAIGELFPDFLWRPVGDRFLPEPEAMNWRTAFRLPDRTGRLHVTMRHSTQSASGETALFFELTARGFSPAEGRESMLQWFDNAHTWIVRGFEDLTGAEVRQKVWRQK